MSSHRQIRHFCVGKAALGTARAREYLIIVAAEATGSLVVVARGEEFEFPGKRRLMNDRVESLWYVERKSKEILPRFKKTNQLFHSL